MKVEDIMVKDVVTIIPDDSTVSAARTMRGKSVGCLVVATNGTVHGIVTDRDLLGCLSEVHDADQCRVSNHMSSPVITERPGEELIRAAQLMADKRIKRLPVAESNRLVGIVSFFDVARVLDEQAQNFWSEWISMMRLIRNQARHERRN